MPTLVEQKMPGKVTITRNARAFHHRLFTVEAERVFSAGGLFLTKLRSSMSDMTLDKLMFLKFFFKLRKDKVFWSLNHISSLTIFYNVVVHFKYSLRFIFGSEHDLMQTVSPKRSNLIIWYFWKLSIYCLIYLFYLDNFEKIIYCLDKKIWQIIRTPTAVLLYHDSLFYRASD